MRLYNTLTRREEEFAPARDNTVRMYTCGLTVYARGHIGNFRTFVVVRRAAPRAEVRSRLRHAAGHELHRRGRPDDPRVAEGRRAAARVHRLATSRRFARMPPRSASNRPEETRARPTTQNIAAMGETIKALERNGHTYRSDGSIYFKIATLPDYGKLARLDHAGIKSGARIDSRQVRQGGRARLRAVEGDQARGADLGSGHRSRAGPAGTSSARRWRCGCSASRRSTSTPAASI